VYLHFTCNKHGDEDTYNAGCPDKEEQVPLWALGQLVRVLRCIGNGGDTTIK
jgi:hypothetical protein